MPCRRRYTIEVKAYDLENLKFGAEHFGYTLSANRIYFEDRLVGECSTDRLIAEEPHYTLLKQAQSIGLILRVGHKVGWMCEVNASNKVTLKLRRFNRDKTLA